MAKERRDSKNRLLKRGEYQKSDGRYMYRYVGTDGQPRFVYSWTLTKSDRAPSGKPPGECLRDLEAKINRDLLDNINTFCAQKATINDYFEKFISSKKRAKETTRNLYRNTYNLYLRNKIGSVKIATVKYSDILRWYNDILEDHGISIATLESVDCVLKPLLKMAVRDELLRDNPACGALAEVSRESGSTSIKRHALTMREQEIFLNYVDNNIVYLKWKNMFTVMLGTGCRIGEICGLTWDDCDFTNNTITINRTICYSTDEQTRKSRLIIQEPKSDAGKRTIPMFDDVRKALWQERMKQMRDGFCKDTIDGISGFVFINKNGGAMMPGCVGSTLRHLVKSHNSAENELAKREHREAVLLPNITPHILRHTFCTRMCESGVDVKVVQEVMGHSNVSMTLNIYNSVTKDYKAVSFQNVDGKFKIS